MNSVKDELYLKMEEENSEHSEAFGDAYNLRK